MSGTLDLGGTTIGVEPAGANGNTGGYTGGNDTSGLGGSSFGTAGGTVVDLTQAGLSSSAMAFANHAFAQATIATLTLAGAAVNIATDTPVGSTLGGLAAVAGAIQLGFALGPLYQSAVQITTDANPNVAAQQMQGLEAFQSTGLTLQDFGFTGNMDPVTAINWDGWKQVYAGVNSGLVVANLSFPLYTPNNYAGSSTSEAGGL